MQLDAYSKTYVTRLNEYFLKNDAQVLKSSDKTKSMFSAFTIRDSSTVAAPEATAAVKDIVTKLPETVLDTAVSSANASTVKPLSKLSLAISAGVSRGT
jgi:hypothetical protein